MGLKTYSKFYYINPVDGSSFNMSFKESAGELIAKTRLGSFTPTQLANEIAVALNAASVDELNYTCTFNRADRTFTISADSNFELLTLTGATAGTSAFILLGFTGADKTGSSSYTGNQAGVEYSPQFILQDYIQPEDWQGAVSESINESASGELEIVRFGVRNFSQFNIKYATNYEINNSHIRNNQTGIDELRSFMVHCTNKRPIEFMPDENDLNNYYSLLLESTPDNQKGTGFKLNELYTQGLFGFYESGKLKFREV